MLGRALEVKFAYTAGRETREVDCLLLRRIDGASLLSPSEPPAEGNPTWTASGGGLTAVHYPLDQLRYWAESLTGKPVLDETSLDDRYDIELEWVDGKGFHEALATIGLELVEARGQVEFVVVKPNAAN